MSTLPRELVVNILSRQPVKSLCRFRCVSKPWLALITHPQFAKLHLSQTRGGQRLFLIGESLYYVDIENISINADNANVAATKVVFPWMESETELVCIGSYNSLLCITTDEYAELFVCNPSTRECKQIPDFDYYDASHGIGYAESIDDYKYVRIYADAKKGIDVYSLRKDSWTNVQNDFRGKYTLVWGVTLNGAIHWMFTGNGPTVIGAFDLVEEKFKTLPLPYDNLKSNYFSYKIGVVNDHLFLIIQKSCVRKVYGPGNQFWIMKDYGVKASWTRSLKLSLRSSYKPLCYLNNTETLLISQYNIMKIFFNQKDPKYLNIDAFDEDGPFKGEFRTLKVDGIDEDHWTSVYTYVESLASPNYKNNFTAEGNSSSSFSILNIFYYKYYFLLTCLSFLKNFLFCQQKMHCGNIGFNEKVEVELLRNIIRSKIFFFVDICSLSLIRDYIFSKNLLSLIILIIFLSLFFSHI
ncbi:hypothetical protein ACOSQ3_032014 [Xanthoceras sorbifolium]